MTSNWRRNYNATGRDTSHACLVIEPTLSFLSSFKRQETWHQHRHCDHQNHAFQWQMEDFLMLEKGWEVLRQHYFLWLHESNCSQQGEVVAATMKSVGQFQSMWVICRYPLLVRLNSWGWVPSLPNGIGNVAGKVNRGTAILCCCSWAILQKLCTRSHIKSFLLYHRTIKPCYSCW